MATTRSAVLGNFVPLLDAVRAIADCVSVSDADADSCRWPDYPADTTEFDLFLMRAQVKRLVAHTRAAWLLYDHLDKAVSPRPAWYSAPKGLLRPADGEIGMGTLINLSSQRVVLPSGRWVAPAHGAAPVDPIDASVAYLGFEANELIAFLDAVKLAHSLGPADPAPPPQTYMQAKSDESVALGEPEARSEQTPSEAAQRIKHKLPRLIPRHFVFRGELAHVLRTVVKAVYEEGNLDDEAAGFEKLYQLADQKTQPPGSPLLMVNHVDREVLWVLDDPDVPERYTEAQWARQHKAAIRRALDAS